jgi:uncharacterized protein YodC (DUF2158 family)
MKFKPGDLVIKCTGGNKMRIVDCDLNGMVNCVWATESLHEGKFNEEELVSVDDYKSVIIGEKRNDLIGKILK